MPRIGFIGLGLMGMPMTKNLVAAGFSVSVWNRSPAKIETAVAAGANACQSATEVANHADIVILSLSDSAAVEQVVLGNTGIGKATNSNSLLVDTSSISPNATRALAAKLQSMNGMRWVDAPVSGGVVGAENGNLNFMLGGSEEDCALVSQQLACLGQLFTHMGPLGSGQTTKILNQMIVGCNAVAIAEVMALAKASDVDATKLADAFAGGFADSKPLQLMAPRMATDTFEPIQWRVATLVKDLHNSIELAESLGRELSVSRHALTTMEQRGENGMQSDLSTLVKVFEK